MRNLAANDNEVIEVNYYYNDGSINMTIFEAARIIKAAEYNEEFHSYENNEEGWSIDIFEGNIYEFLSYNGAYWQCFDKAKVDFIIRNI